MTSQGEKNYLVVRWTRPSFWSVIFVAIASASYFGQGGGRRVIDLAVHSPDIIFIGGASAWELGTSTVVGDLNGDGNLDLVLGAPGAAGPDGTRIDAGHVLVFLFFQRRDKNVDIRSTSADLIIYGAEARDRLGDISALAVGDVTGDGLDDLILGSRSAAVPGAGRRNPGAVNVIFGRTNLGGTIDLATTSADLTIYGADPLDWFGQTVAAADCNNDGVDDLIVGAPLGDGPDNTRINSGEVVIFFGGSHLRGVRDLALTAADVVIYGADAGDFLGTALAAGDINGDGRRDLAVASLGSDGPGNGRGDATGEVSVVFGRDPFPRVIDLTREPPSWVIYGRDAGDFFGFRIVLKDLNNDGLADVIASAPRGDGPRNGRTSAGEVSVIFGSRSAGGALDLARRSPGFIIYGADSGDELGFQIGVGDVTGDEVADIVCTAPGGDGPNNRRGEATGEVIAVTAPTSTGRQIFPVRSIDLATEAPPLVVYGSQTGEALGSSLFVAPIIGDGKADLLIGARLASPVADRPRAGRVYILSGS